MYIFLYDIRDCYVKKRQYIFIILYLKQMKIFSVKIHQSSVLYLKIIEDYRKDNFVIPCFFNFKYQILKYSVINKKIKNYNNMIFNDLDTNFFAENFVSMHK